MNSNINTWKEQEQNTYLKYLKQEKLIDVKELIFQSQLFKKSDISSINFKNKTFLQKGFSEKFCALTNYDFR